MNLTAYALLLISIILAVAGQLALKYGMSKHPGFKLTHVLRLIRDRFVVGGFCCYGFSLLLYFKVLESLPLSLAFPTISLGYAAVVIISSALFKEPVSTARWVAVSIICIGVALVGLGA